MKRARSKRLTGGGCIQVFAHIAELGSQRLCIRGPSRVVGPVTLLRVVLRNLCQFITPFLKQYKTFQLHRIEEIIFLIADNKTKR